MSKDMIKTTVTGRFIGGGLFEPRSTKEGKEPKYNAVIVLDEGEEAKVAALIEAVIQERWGDRRPRLLDVYGVWDGDDPDSDSTYQKKFINPKTGFPPSTAYKDKDGTVVKATEEDDIIYPGCYVAVAISAYGFEADKSKDISKPGVTLGLRGLFFITDGDRLSYEFNAEEEFGEYQSDFASIAPSTRATAAASDVSVRDSYAKAKGKEDRLANANANPGPRTAARTATVKTAKR